MAKPKPEFKPEIVWRSPDSLTPYFRNAKKHPTEQIDKIASSIAEFKFDQPIVIDGQGVIIKGHGRREAAIRLGIKEVPVIVREDLSEVQAKAARMADNRVAESPWDDEILKLEFADLKLADFEMGLMGFDEIELMGFDLGVGTKGKTDPDEMPDEKAIEDRVKLGDIWGMGAHRLLCGDCKEDGIIGRIIPNNKTPLYTDPPYGMGLNEDFDQMFKGDKTKHQQKGHRFKPIIGDDEKFDPGPLLAFFGGDVFLWGADYFYDRLPPGGSFSCWDKRDDALDRVPGNPSEFIWTRKPRRRMSFRVKWSGHHGMGKDDEKKGFTPHKSRLGCTLKYLIPLG